MAINKELYPVENLAVRPHPWARSIKDIVSHRIKQAHNSVRNPKYPTKPVKEPDEDRVQITIVGDRVSKEFTYCTQLVKGLHKYRWKKFHVPIIRGVSSVAWPDVLRDLKARFVGEANCIQTSDNVAVLLDDTVLGGERELKTWVETQYEYRISPEYCKEGVSEFAKFLRSNERPCAYMHVSINNEHIGTFLFLLYSDIVPQTCDNFLRLCKERKGGYGGTPVHRIVKDGWIQCGGFGLKNTALCCENFVVPLDKRGVLAMANDGRDNDCSTQFFVLLQPAVWMRHKYVAFGQLIDGEETLKKIENTPTWYEAPISKIVLYRCGILNMECQDIMINRGANEYIDGHIEDLNLLCEILWESLLEKVFLEARFREIARMQERVGEGEGSVMDEQKQIDAGKNEEEAQSEEDVIDYKHLTYTIASPSLVVKPQKPFYIPLTDVPYPGDVDSDYDMKNFLKGNHCLECDLDKKTYPKKAHKEVIQFPSILLLPYASGSSSQSDSLNSEELRELSNYLKDNVDRVSFAGGIVKGIAKGDGTTNIFSGQDWNRRQSIGDEQLRKLRLAESDLKWREEHKTNVSNAVDAIEPKIVKQRQTGVPKEEALKKVNVVSPQIISKDTSTTESSDGESSNRRPKHVQLKPGSTTKISQKKRPRPTGHVRPQNYQNDILKDKDDDDDDKKKKEKPSPDKKQVQSCKTSFASSPESSDSPPYEAVSKRRPTAFVWTKFTPEDDDDDDIKSEDVEDTDNTLAISDKKQIQQNKITFASSLKSTTSTSSSKASKRRLTAFVRPNTYAVDNNDDDMSKVDEEQEAKSPISPKDEVSQTNSLCPRTSVTIPDETAMNVTDKSTYILREKVKESPGKGIFFNDVFINFEQSAPTLRDYRKVSIAAPGAFDPEIVKEIKRRQTGFVNAEDLEKIRVFSRQTIKDSSSEGSDDESSDVDGKGDVRMKPGTKSKKVYRKIQRRLTGYIRPEDLQKLIEKDDEDDDDNDDNKNDGEDNDTLSSKKHDLTSKTTFAVSPESSDEPPDEAISKRRPTAFVWPRFTPKDDDDDEDQEEEEKKDTEQVLNSKIKFDPSPSLTTSHDEALCKRRPTAFVRPGSFPIDDDDDDDDEEERPLFYSPSKPPEPTIHQEMVIPTSNKLPEIIIPSVKSLEITPSPLKLPQVPLFKRTQETNMPSILKLPEIKDEKQGTSIPGDVTKPKFQQSPKLPEVSNKLKVQDKNVMPSIPDTSSESILAKRRPSGNSDSDDSDKPKYIMKESDRDTAFGRLMEEVDNPYGPPAPTLKDYRPISDRHHIKLFLTKNAPIDRTVSATSRLAEEKKAFRSMQFDMSLEDMLNIQYGANVQQNLSSEYANTVDEIGFQIDRGRSIRTMEYARKRPTISVSQYKLMNRQYQEERKKPNISK